MFDRSMPIWNVAFDADDSIVAMTLHGLHRYDVTTKTWTDLGMPVYAQSQFGYGPVTDGAGGWYVAGNEGLYHAPAGGTLTRITDTRGMIAGGSGKLYSTPTSADTMYELVDNAWVVVPPTGLPDGTPMSRIFSDPQGNLYTQLTGFGTPVYKREGSAFVPYTPCSSESWCMGGQGLSYQWLPSGDMLLWRYVFADARYTFFGIKSSSGSTSEVPAPPSMEFPITTSMAASGDNALYFALAEDQYTAGTIYGMPAGGDEWTTADVEMPTLFHALYVSPKGRVYTASAQHNGVSELE